VDGRATELFQRLHSPSAESVIDELIFNRQSEELWLDFKRVATSDTDSKLHADDRKNLARAISGFGNSVGGIIIWGVECSPRSDSGDVASAKFKIERVSRLKSWLEAATSACSIPPHSRVEHLIVARSSSDAGFIATHIPPSSFAPLQPVIQGGTVQHCLIRVGSSFMPAPIGLLAAMFGKRPQNRIVERWVLNSSNLEMQQTRVRTVCFDAFLGLRNEGPGMARELYLNVSWSNLQLLSSLNFGQIHDGHWERSGGTAAQVSSYSSVSNDSYKLAPDFHIYLWNVSVRLSPPFESPFHIKLSYGTEGSPSTIREIRHSPSELEELYNNVIRSGYASTAMRPLLRLDEESGV